MMRMQEVMRIITSVNRAMRVLAGNHDASGQGEPTQWWFRKWLDPTGENTPISGVDPKRRRYPVTGTWERYEFRVGNLLFLVMSDRNDLPLPVGRGKRGGYPAGAIDLWIGGHTHAKPDDALNGRTHVERKWDANFINCCALTRFHGAEHSRPMSRLLTFSEGSTEVRVQCYLHTNTHAPQGWYPKAERVIKIGKPFRLN